MSIFQQSGILVLEIYQKMAQLFSLLRLKVLLSGFATVAVLASGSEQQELSPGTLLLTQ